MNNSGRPLLCCGPCVPVCSWEDAIKQAMIGQDDLLSPELPSSPIGNELSGGLGVSSLAPWSKGLSIYPSSQHAYDCQPEQHTSTDEEDIVSYKLSRGSTSTSKESEVSPGWVQQRVERYEQKLCASIESEGSSAAGHGLSTQHQCWLWMNRFVRFVYCMACITIHHF